VKKLSLCTLLLLGANVTGIVGMTTTLFGGQVDTRGVVAIWIVSAMLLIWSVAKDERELPGG